MSLPPSRRRVQRRRASHYFGGARASPERINSLRERISLCVRCAQSFSPSHRCASRLFDWCPRHASGNLSVSCHCLHPTFVRRACVEPLRIALCTFINSVAPPCVAPERIALCPASSSLVVRASGLFSLLLRRGWAHLSVLVVRGNAHRVVCFVRVKPLSSSLRRCRLLRRACVRCPFFVVSASCTYASVLCASLLCSSLLCSSRLCSSRLCSSHLC